MMGLDFDFGDRGEFEFTWKENWLKGKVLPEGYQVWFTDGYRSLGWRVCVPGKVGASVFRSRSGNTKVIAICSVHCVMYSVHSRHYKLNKEITKHISTSIYYLFDALTFYRMGEVVIELYWRHAPSTCRNFAELCRRGYYNGTKFHRIIRDFMIQGK